MNRLLDYVGGDFIYALGWTLIHSIWQVGLVAVAVALIMMRIDARKSSSRYSIYMGAILVVPILSVATFMRLYSGVESTSVASTSLGAENPYLNEALSHVSGSLVNPGTWEMIVNYLNLGPENLQYLVIIWFAGVLMLSIRFMGGVWAINRLRGSASKDISYEWMQRLARLSESLGIRRVVQMAESARVTVPMTAGWLKPIILLPIGMLANMPLAHVEMILLHELSHIRRHDYLMNLMQGFVEIVFFFHPAIWWLSDGARTEREHCCDDRVLSLRGDPLAYAKALHAAAAAIKSKGVARGSLLPKTGLALTGENGELLERIHRILNREMKNNIYSTRFTASTVMVVGLCLFLMLAPNNAKNNASTSGTFLSENVSTSTPVTSGLDRSSLSVGLASPAITDSIPPKNREITIYKNDRGEITDIYVNGKRIPKSDYDQYETEIGRADRRAPKPPVPPTPQGLSKTATLPIPPIPALIDSLDWTKFAQSMEEMANLTAKTMSTFDEADFERRMELFASDMDKWAQKYEKETEQKSKEIERNMEMWSQEYEREMERWAEEYEKKMNSSEWKEWEKAMEKWGEEYGKSWEDWGKQFEANQTTKMSDFEKSMEGFGKSMEAFGAKMEAWGKRMAEMEAEVKRELVKDGFIRNVDDEFSLKMTRDGMYVDDVKLSDTLTKKYRNIIKKYNNGDFDVKNLEFNLQFNNN